MAIYLKQRQDLFNKIDGLTKSADYLRRNTEKGEESSSFEASLLHEIRYRDTLNVLVNAEQELIMVYDKALQGSREYIVYLERLAEDK